MEHPHLKSYRTGDDQSYALGPFVALELLRHKPETARAIVLSSNAERNSGASELIARAAVLHIPHIVSDKAVSRLSPKENCWALAAYRIWEDTLDPLLPHVVLVSPSDPGNVGTIMRTALGFGLRDIAIISPAADIHHPKTVRASMGALFAIRTQVFPSFDDWRERHKGHAVYPFMLTGSRELQDIEPSKKFALVFGNESSGLPESFSGIGTPVRIDHSPDIDSLNLSVAAAIGIWRFTLKTSVRH